MKVRNECGHCEPTCDVTQFGGEGGLPLNPTEDNSSSISLNDDGTLTVFSEEVDVQFAWIAVDQGGVVSKIDTRTGEEVGRYCTALGPSAQRVPQGVETDYGRVRGVSNICGACTALATVALEPRSLKDLETSLSPTEPLIIREPSQR